LRTRKRQTILIAVLFLFVPLTLLGIFTYYPIIRGVVLSFGDYNMFTKKVSWVGLKNYEEIFHNKYFYEALINIFKYLVIVPFIQLTAILTAILVNQNLPGIKFFRTLFYIPVITGSVIVSMTWRWIYNVDGLLNNLLLSIGIIKEPVLWLTDERFALYSVMFVTFWRGIGYYMVIYLAGLQNIPSELYEAARIDGANGRQILTRITLPLLSPTMLFCFTISSLAALKVFEEVFLMTQGGSGTTTMMYLIYDYAFVRFKFGLSTATSVIFSGILIIFTIINFRFFGARGDKR